jgi:alcohol dehydrogenase (cytochrome c)
MDPKQDRQMRSRGAALSGNLVITGAGGFGNSPRIIATDKETGKVVWETSFSDTPDVTFTAAPLAIINQSISSCTAFLTRGIRHDSIRHESR